MDEPTAGPGLFPQYMVSRLASDKVKVALGGQGGDEIFGGYARFVIAYLEQAIKGAIFGHHNHTWFIFLHRYIYQDESRKILKSPIKESAVISSW